MKKGIISYQQGKAGSYNYFLLEDLKEWQLLEMQDKYHTEEVELIMCDCGMLYEEDIGCLRCDKLKFDAEQEYMDENSEDFKDEEE